MLLCGEKFVFFLKRIRRYFVKTKLISFLLSRCHGASVGQLVVLFGLLGETVSSMRSGCRFLGLVPSPKRLVFV